MRNEYLNLTKVIDLEKWQNLQDSVSLVTRMALITIDYKGNPVTKHSSCQPFCQRVRNDPDLSRYCQKCDSRGGLEAVRLNAPYIYLCHYNIIDVAIPIIVDDKYIGAIMAGQIKLADTQKATTLEQIVTSSDNKLVKQKWEYLKSYYEMIPQLAYEDIITNTDMLFVLCNYIVTEALNKNLILEMYQKIYDNKHAISITSTLPGYTLENIKHLKKEMSNAITDAYLDSSSYTITNHPILKPALAYISSNKGENITLNKMAELCHISPSYFSRLFSKETGEKFSTYLSYLKIEWAKQLLEETDVYISQISNDLGFNEVGYFIKVFKKYEGVTPSIYRKYYKKY